MSGFSGQSAPDGAPGWNPPAGTAGAGRTGRRQFRSVCVRAVPLLAATLGLHAGQAQVNPFAGDGRKPQAKTQEELDLYLELYASSEPRETVAQAVRFEAAHPDSEFLGLAFQHKMAALRDLGDYDGALKAGATALELVPRNVHALVTLASVIPNGVDGRADRGDLLAKARRYASLALAELETLKIPAEIPLEEAESLRAALQAAARESLGHVAVKEGDLAEAVRQFEAAVAVNLHPTPSQWYRLGGAYLMAGQLDNAIEPLRRAAESDEPIVRRLALDQLRQIQETTAR